MAWVQVGSRKINTANVCYLEQNEEKLVIHFQGNANILELSADEAKGLWRHLKAEDAMYVKDKGSAMVLQPKRVSAPMPVVLDVGADKAAGAATEKPRTPATSGGHGPSSHGHGHSHRPHSSSHSQGSSSHSQSHSHSQKPAEVRKA